MTQALVDEALEIACVNDRVEIVQWLVAFGADPKLPLGHSAYPGVVHAAAVSRELGPSQMYWIVVQEQALMQRLSGLGWINERLEVLEG